MAHKDKKQSNKGDELIDIRGLIGDADGGGFSLDDILSEYGVPTDKERGQDLPWPEAPHRPRGGNNVVLFPGASQPEPRWKNIRYVRPRRKEETPPPDTAPQELAKQYGKQLKGMRLRVVLPFFLSLLSMSPILLPMLGYRWLPPMDDYQLQVFLSAGLLGVGMLLSFDVLFGSVKRMLKGRLGMDGMSLFASLFTLADAITLGLYQNRGDQMPYCMVALITLMLLTHGHYHKLCAQRLSCRTAAAAAHPYRVTLDPEKWNGKAAYSKWAGEPDGFGSQIQMDDGAQRIYRVVCPVLALGCVLLSLLSSVAQEQP